MKTRDTIKILLMQVRKDKESQNREFNAFVTLSGLRPDQIEVWNVFEQSEYAPTQLDAFDALFVGGSSDDPKDSLILDVERFPFINSSIALFTYAREKNIPVLASCMGLEIYMQAINEPLVFEKDNPEQGFARVELTEAGKKDPLFADMPDSFYAVSWHAKQCGTAPIGSIVLAKTDICPVHAFTYPDSKFYAFQFHPEFSDADLISLLETYATRYAGGVEAFERVKAERQSTAQANSLVSAFIDTIILS